MVGLYYLHVRVDHLQVLEAMGPSGSSTRTPETDEDYVPPTKSEMTRELAERKGLANEVTTTRPPSHRTSSPVDIDGRIDMF
jgi:hypothetical protein